MMEEPKVALNINAPLKDWQNCLNAALAAQGQYPTQEEGQQVTIRYQGQRYSVTKNKSSFTVDV